MTVTDFQNKSVTIAKRPDRLPAYIEHVRDDVHVRIARRRFAAGALVRRRVERAEMPREREQVIVAQALIAEKNHIVAVPRRLDGVDFCARDAGEIYALDFGSEGRHGTHLEIEDGGHAAAIIAKYVDS